MRLYRGLKRKYDPKRVAVGIDGNGTNFTDCPYAALGYATGRYGVVLVLDVPEDEHHRFFEALWGIDDTGPRRYMTFGRFDHYVVAQLPGKELRALLSGRGMSTLSDESRASILSQAIQHRLAGRALVS